MTQESDALSGMQDQFKSKMGGEATWCFLFTAPIAVIVQDGWRALISWRAAGFIVIGMFIAAIALGNAAYWTYFAIFSGMKKKWEAGQLDEARVMASMRPLGCAVSLGLLAVSAIVSWFVWGWLS